MAASWYNDVMPARYRLPNFDREDAFTLVVGNTRALWSVFVAAYAGDETLQSCTDPLDRYVEGAVTRALGSLSTPWEPRWAPDPPPRRVSMVQLAHRSGLAYLTPAHFCVHPQYGPWIALRAAIVFDLAGPEGAAPVWVPPCDACDHSCHPLFERAVAASDRDDAPQLGRSWSAWLAVRDACPVGRTHRYSSDQIWYHYTKDRSALGSGPKGSAQKEQQRD